MMDRSNTSGDSSDQQDKKSSATTTTQNSPSNASATSHQDQQRQDIVKRRQQPQPQQLLFNRGHQNHSNLLNRTSTQNQQSVAINTNQTSQDQSRNNPQGIIASVERPSITAYPARTITSPIPIDITRKPNNTDSNQQNTLIHNNGSGSATNNANIISQLQQLQSPPPQPTPKESPVTQLTKPRHRGFFSQLLCCFRPSRVYYDPNLTYKDTDLSQNQNSLTPKYSGKYLLPARKPSDNRICLVIDLDETLVHSSFKPIENADFIVPVEIDGSLHKVYVLKRPHVDEFLKRMGQIYECVLFTASLAKYADPVADLLDTGNIFNARLFRESCAFYRGNYVKDLSRLGRDLNRVIIVDNSPASYIFHPDNAVSIKQTNSYNSIEHT